MRIFESALIGASCALLSACLSTGLPPSRFPPAMRPEGVSGVIGIRNGGEHMVELLEVTDTAYVVLAINRVAIAPYAKVTLARFDYLAWADYPSLRHPSADDRDRLRFFSRFPFGMPRSALDELLRLGGQRQPDLLGLTIQ